MKRWLCHECIALVPREVPRITVGRLEPANCRVCGKLAGPDVGDYVEGAVSEEAHRLLATKIHEGAA